ncbi:MAG: hypothetical protein K8I82_11805, partial [Anaerolineae bacterium]|nr:hypothetical protein [Anaerolineae bacterium]
YTLWGTEEKLGLFENPPNARVTVEEAQLYYEANSQFPRSPVPAGTYLWVTHRSADGQWYKVDSEWGDVQWIEASAVELLDSGEELPVYA